MEAMAYIIKADAKDINKGVKLYAKDAKLAEFTPDKKKAYKFNADEASAKVERLNENIHPMQKGYIVYIIELVEQKGKTEAKKDAEVKPAARAVAKADTKVKTKSKKSE